MKFTGAVIALCLALMVIATGRSDSKQVASNHILQKRKYRKGVFVNLGAPKRVANTKQNSFEAVYKSKPESRALRTIKPQEVDQSSLDRPRLRELPVRARRLSEVEDDHASTSAVMAMSERSSVEAISLGIASPLDEEPEEQSARKTMTLLTKIFAALASFLLVVAFVLVVTIIATAVSLTSIATAIILSIAIAGVLSILLSLLFAYILYERYDDTDPMQWTLFASYVVEAILIVGSYLLYGLAFL